MSDLTDWQKEYVGGLRELASFLEDHPQFITPYSVFQVDLFPFDRETFDSMARSLGGKRDNLISEYYAMVRRPFGPHRIDVNIARDQVCERVVVGTREVPETVVPARTEEIVEWRCDGFEVLS